MEGYRVVRAADQMAAEKPEFGKKAAFARKRQINMFLQQYEEII
jgi:hypothetical protein